MELLPSYEPPIDMDAHEHDLQRQQERLDRQWEKGDCPDVWPPSPQDIFPQHSHRRPACGLLGGTRTAPTAAASLRLGTAVGALAPTFNEE